MYIKNTIRKKLLKNMDDFIRENVADEEIAYGIWYTMGVPDGADESDYEEAVEDDEFWTDCLEAFARTLIADFKNN